MSAQDLATLQVWGAGGFGAVIGWYLYFINRYRKGDVQIGDITTVIGAIGGGAVTALFDPHKTGDLFSAYGLGLAIGFFTYFLGIPRSPGRTFEVFHIGLVPRRSPPQPA